MENYDWLDKYINEQAKIHKQVYGSETIVSEVADAIEAIGDDELEEYANANRKELM